MTDDVVTDSCEGYSRSRTRRVIRSVCKDNERKTTQKSTDDSKT